MWLFRFWSIDQHTHPHPGARFLGISSRSTKQNPLISLLSSFTLETAKSCHDYASAGGFYVATCKVLDVIWKQKNMPTITSHLYHRNIRGITYGLSWFHEHDTFYIYQILPPQSAEPMRKFLVDVSTSSRLTDDYEAGLS